MQFLRPQHLLFIPSNAPTLQILMSWSLLSVPLNSGSFPNSYASRSHASSTSEPVRHPTENRSSE